MRSRYKMWRNDRGGKWTRRIIWFQGEAANDIRLECLSSIGEFQHFPATRAEADAMWQAFKDGDDLLPERFRKDKCDGEKTAAS